jgi:hypothetical protein
VIPQLWHVSAFKRLRPPPRRNMYVNVLRSFNQHLSTYDFPPFRNMKVRRAESWRCFSPSRVTANLLLSFLALSTPSQARDQAPINSPIAIPPLVPGGEPSDQNSYHDFVRILGFLVICTKLTARLFATYSTMEPTEIRVSTNASTSTQTRRYGLLRQRHQRIKHPFGTFRLNLVE